MGCLSLHLLKACTVGSSKIKVMTVDGRCLKFEAPIIVKEVLMDYPLHALFHSETVRTLGNRARPLQGTLSLQPGHLYFLVPQPSRSRSSGRSAGTASLALPQVDLAATDLTAARSQELDGSTTRRRKVSFKCTAPETSTEISHCAGSVECAVLSAASMESLTSASSMSKSSVQFLPSPSDGVLRLKMVVSKRQLVSVLKEGGDCVSMVEGLLSPLLREAEASISDARSLSWRPSLESIPESSCPLQRASKNAL